MGGVYSKASRVLVWIGESQLSQGSADSESERVLRVKYVKLLYRHFNPFLYAHRVHHFTAAIQNTSSHWWTRAWVVQEAACAQKITVLFGPCAINWPFVSGCGSLSVGIQSFILEIRDESVFFDEPFKQIIYEAANAFGDIESLKRRRRRNQPSTLGKLLLRTRQTKATNAHDKVYSLLGLMAAEERAYLQPDYREPISETFAKATVAAIASQQSLDILGWVRLNSSHSAAIVNSDASTPRSADFPSWVVDFTDTEYTLFDTSVRTMIENVWGKAPNLANEVRYLGSGRMEVSGQHLDTVCAHVPFTKWEHPWPAPGDDILHVSHVIRQAAVLATHHSPIEMFAEGQDAPSRAAGAPFPTARDWYDLLFVHDLPVPGREFEGDYLGHSF